MLGWLLLQHLSLTRARTGWLFGSIFILFQVRHVCVQLDGSFGLVTLMNTDLILHSAEEHAIHHTVISDITCSVFLLKEARILVSLDRIALCQSIYFGIRKFDFGAIPLPAAEHHGIQALLHLSLKEANRLDGLLLLILVSLVFNN